MYPILDDLAFAKDLGVNCGDGRHPFTIFFPAIAGENKMPFLTSVAPTWNRVLIEDLLAALMTRPAGAQLTTPTVHLYTSVSQAIGPNTPQSAFTEANFTGYSAVVLSTLLGPINLPGTDGYGVHQEADFTATAVVSPGQTVLGYWIDNGTSTMYYAEAFSAPVPFVNSGDFLSLDVIFGLPAAVTTN
jgi:hypothetical protein